MKLHRMENLQPPKHNPGDSPALVITTNPVLIYCNFVKICLGFLANFGTRCDYASVAVVRPWEFWTF